MKVDNIDNVIRQLVRNEILNNENYSDEKKINKLLLLENNGSSTIDNIKTHAKSPLGKFILSDLVAAGMVGGAMKIEDSHPLIAKGLKTGATGVALYGEWALIQSIYKKVYNDCTFTRHLTKYRCKEKASLAALMEAKEVYNKCDKDLKCKTKALNIIQKYSEDVKTYRAKAEESLAQQKYS